MLYVIDVAPNLWADTFGRPGLSAPVLESTATGFAPVWASPVMRPGLFDTKDAKSSKLTKVVFRCRRPGPGCLSRECNVALLRGLPDPGALRVEKNLDASPDSEVHCGINDVGTRM